MNRHKYNIFTPPLTGAEGCSRFASEKTIFCQAQNSKYFKPSKYDYQKSWD